MKRILLGLLLVPCIGYAMEDESDFVKDQIIKKDGNPRIWSERYKTFYIKDNPSNKECMKCIEVSYDKKTQKYWSTLEEMTPNPIYGASYRYKWGQEDQDRDAALFDELADAYEQQQREIEAAKAEQE
jgi:hypothetical protein